MDESYLAKIGMRLQCVDGSYLLEPVVVCQTECVSHAVHIRFTGWDVMNAKCVHRYRLLYNMKEGISRTIYG